jgi:hypothetical protein
MRNHRAIFSYRNGKFLNRQFSLTGFFRVLVKQWARENPR